MAAPGYRGADATSPLRLATIVYSSRAVMPFTAEELQPLMRAAQARNHQEGVTGVVLYDDSRFFQWLEGPEDGVERVMDSIRNDWRHTDLQVLSRRSGAARRFDGWDMKLAASGMAQGALRREVIDPPLDLIDELRREPGAAPHLLARLVPMTDELEDDDSDQPPYRTAMSRSAARVLKSVILSKVIPRLLDARAEPGGGPGRASVKRAAELAELLVASDAAASLGLIRELRGGVTEGRALFAPVFEPAARSLGDMWADDAVSEAEVTLALCRLQMAVRLLDADATRATPPGAPSVLVAPAPGELHQTVGALDSEWLWREGWSPRFEFPADDRALADLVSARWVDVLDLSLSAAFRRGDRLPRLSKTITLARQASLNPDLLVVVGGRAFVEDRRAGLGVGADLASRTSMSLDRLMMRGLEAVAGPPERAPVDAAWWPAAAAGGQSLRH